MSKNLLQDVVKVKNIKTEKVGMDVRRPDIDKELSFVYKKNNDNFKNDKDTDYSDGENKRSRYGLWIVACISAAVLFFALSFLFSSAKVVIDPKIQDANISLKLFATKDTTNTEDLPFDFVSIADEDSSTVQASSEEEKDVSISAKGTVIIYNTYSSSPQNLDIDTRLEGSNGKIYKTQAKVTIPGTSGGKPGQVQVGIYGSEPGDTYNSLPLDFKIFGFKGSPKYSKFYARSQGPISGGMKGKAKVVSDDEKTKAEADLKNTLQAKLLKQATDQIPPGFVLFKDAVFLTTDTAQSTVDSNGGVTLTMSGTLYGFIFDEKKVTKKIAESTVAGYDGSDLYIPNIKDLSFSIFSKDALSFKDTTNMTFNLSGMVKLVWKVDTGKMTGELVGKKKKDFSGILTTYPNINTASLTIRPIWKMSFPDQIKNIKILVNYPK